MLNIICPCGRTHLAIRVLPLHCGCSVIHWGDKKPVAAPPLPRKTVTPCPRTFGTILREMVGCGCNLPLNKWDNHGLQWCKENTNAIVEHLIRKPKPGLERNQAIEMVQLAIKIVEPK